MLIPAVYSRFDHFEHSGNIWCLIRKTGVHYSRPESPANFRIINPEEYTGLKLFTVGPSGTPSGTTAPYPPEQLHSEFIFCLVESHYLAGRQNRHELFMVFLR